MAQYVRLLLLFFLQKDAVDLVIPGLERADSRGLMCPKAKLYFE